MPVLFVCEDNGIGISAKTPRGWIEHAYADRADLPISRRTASICATSDAARRRRAGCAPIGGRVSSTSATVRLLGHAGSD